MTDYVSEGAFELAGCPSIGGLGEPRTSNWTGGRAGWALKYNPLTRHVLGLGEPRVPGYTGGSGGAGPMAQFTELSTPLKIAAAVAALAGAFLIAKHFKLIKGFKTNERRKNRNIARSRGYYARLGYRAGLRGGRLSLPSSLTASQEDSFLRGWQAGQEASGPSLR